MAKPQPVTKERLLAKVQVIDECWVWQGCKDRNGYGVITKNYRQLRLNRVSYELFIGAISNNMHVCHMCDNPACINPKHLFLGTNRQNIDDMMAKKRQTWGERNGGAKLTAEQVGEIKCRIGLGGKGIVNRLADEYGVNRITISRIRNNHSWTELQ